MIIGTPQRNIYFGLIASKTLIVAVCLFFLAVNGWSACSQSIEKINTGGKCSTWIRQGSGDGSCSFGTSRCEIRYTLNSNGTISQIRQCIDPYNSNYYWYVDCPSSLGGVSPEDLCEFNPGMAGCKTLQQECEEQGLSWIDNACVDPSNCSPYREKCESIGGKFTGKPVPTEVSETGCLSFCSMCNSEAKNNYRRALSKNCCDMGQVPPENVTRCLDNALSGSPDMSWSLFDCDKRGDNDCSCDYLSSENSSRYKSVCIDNDFEDPNPMPGSGSSSSEEGEGTSSGGEVPPTGPDYYPILDTIRDTTIQIKRYMGEIVDCLRYGTCEGLKGDTTIVNVDGGGSDSAFIKKTNVKLDSIYDIIADGDTNIVKGLVALDSDLVKAIRQNPPISDSSYIKSTADSISAANDTTRKWMKRIADSLGVGTDSLIAHLDSIVKHIPDTLLDSILKYQRYATDNYDSVLYGKGKGFSLIDSLIDSTIKYLGEGTSVLGDSIGNIGSKLDSMYNGNGSLPGDTSGSNIYDGWADDEGSDTTGNGYLLGLGALAQAGINDTSLDRIYGTNSSSSSVGDTSIYSLPSVDSLNTVLQESIEQDYKDLEDTLKNYFDTLRNEIQLINFDSAIIAPLGLKVPNTNTCPVDCFTIDLSGAGSIYSSVKGLSWPLCKSYSAMAGLNVLQFIRLILRIVTAIGCVYIGMWFIAGKK